MNVGKLRPLLWKQALNLEVGIAPPHFEESALLVVDADVHAMSALAYGCEKGDLDIDQEVVVVHRTDSDLQKKETRGQIAKNRIDVGVGCAEEEEVGLVKPKLTFFAAEEVARAEGWVNRFELLKVAVAVWKTDAISDVAQNCGTRTTY